MEFEIPTVPNFIRTISNPLSPESKVFHICELSDQDLGEIGRLWTQNLLERAADVRKSRLEISK